METINIRKKPLGKVLADEFKTACKHGDSIDVLKRLKLNRHQLYNITGMKTTSGGNEFDVPAGVAIRLGTEFGQFGILKEIAKQAGCRLITPEDADGLEDLDKHLESLTYISTVLGIANQKIRG